MTKSLRKGKTKAILESSVNCALLAVEIYNKPRAPFRVEGFITHMIIAWTRLFHAYFNDEKVKYFYREKGSTRFKKVNGEKKSWELITCIRKYEVLEEPIVKNLEFMIGLRNKIEHRHVDDEELGVKIFGECQSLLNNYEDLVIDFFGEGYAINQNLAYSLQFSRIRTRQQRIAVKKQISTDLEQVFTYVDKFRRGLKEDTWGSQEFSLKLIQLPKISNTNRADMAIEFINWNSLSGEDKENFDKVYGIIKDKKVPVPAINPGKNKPMVVVNEVNNKVGITFNSHDHKCLWTIFKIRPSGSDIDPYNVNEVYCNYDEVHEDYLYKQEWTDFLVHLISSGMLAKEEWRGAYSKKEVLNIEDYELDT